MAKFEITGPDGGRFEVTAPDGASEQDVLRFAQSQISQAHSAPSGLQQIQASAPGRLVQGMRDPIDAGAQLLAHAMPESVTNALDYFPAKLRNSNSPFLQTVGESFFADPRAGATDKRLAQTEREYQAARQASAPQTMSGLITGVKEDPGFDAMRLAGNIVSPVNAAAGQFLPAAISTLGRAATGAIAGGAGGALIPVTHEGNFAGQKTAQIGLGAATGGIVTPILGKAIDVIAPRVNAYIESMTAAGQNRTAQAAQQTDELIGQAIQEVGGNAQDIPPQALQTIRQQVSDALRTGKRIDPAALLRKQDFEALNIPPTLGQVTREPMQFATERNLRGADPRLATRFNSQSRMLADALKQYSGEAIEPQAAGQQMIAHLADVDRQAGDRVTAAYDAARQSAGRELEIPLHGLAQDIQRISEDYGTALPSAIKSRLESFGIGGGTQTKVFTATDAEQVLQQINKLRGSDKATNNALSEVASAVKNAITSADEQGGAFAGARELAAQRFRAQDMIPALKAASSGDASADRFVGQYLIRGETKYVKALAEELKKSSPDLYQQARAQLGQELMRSAYGENAAADAAIKPQALAKAIREMGSGKLEAFFSPSEVDQLRKVARVGSYIESIPAAAPVNTSNSFTAALPWLAKIPGAGMASTVARGVGAMGRNISNASAVNKALAANIPTTPELPLTTQQALARAIALSGTGAGMLTAAGVNSGNQ